MPAPSHQPPHWVKYDPRAHSLETASVSPEAELAHRRLADSVWGTGRWPKVGAAALAALTRTLPAHCHSVMRELRSLGWHTHGTSLVHHGIEAVLHAATSAQCLAAKKGRLGAAARWQSPPATPDLPYGTGISPANGSKSKSKTENQNQSTESDLNALNDAERLTCSASAREKRPQEEQEFLADVREIMCLFSPKAANTELDNWGGWWRNRFRDNPAKAQRVLAEIKGMIKERKILDNPGAAATDLWKRFP